MSQIVNWTPAMEDKLARLWGIYLQKDIAKVMGLTKPQVVCKAQRMGLSSRRARKKMEPSRDIWTDIAKKHAAKAKVAPRELLAGTKSPNIVVARWAAWREVLDTHPEISISGLARISGFDHTTILHGLRRLGGASVGSIKQTRASGRRPHVPAILTAEAA